MWIIMSFNAIFDCERFFFMYFMPRIFFKKKVSLSFVDSSNVFIQLHKQ